MTQQDSEAPGWFRRALKAPFEDREVTVAGTPIHYLYWAERETLPGLVLVNGNGAHAHWWRFIAPFFLKEYRVAALDLSGMGAINDDQSCPIEDAEKLGTEMASKILNNTPNNFFDWKN